MDVKFPIGQLRVPEEITMENVQEWLQDISTYTDRLQELIKPLTDQELEKTYREGSWNIRQLIHHIADSQLNMYQRLKLALTDEHPTVPPFDQDEWAVLPDTKLSVKSSLSILEGINQRIVALGKHLTEDKLNRTFMLAGGEKITLGEKLAKLSWHEEHHLAHIKIALEK